MKGGVDICYVLEDRSVFHLILEEEDGHLIEEILVGLKVEALLMLVWLRV